MTKTEQNDAGEDVEREIHFLKGYTVFNVEQIEGLPAQYYVKPEPKMTPVQRVFDPASAGSSGGPAEELCQEDANSVMLCER